MRNISWLHLTAALAPVLALCACSGGGSSSGMGGSKASSGSNGGGDFNPSNASASGSGAGMGGGASCDGALPVTIRDFTTKNPDFEPENDVDDKAIVTPDLGADGKPVYAGNPTTVTTHGKAGFDQWYRDVPGANVTIPITLKLTPGMNGVFTYDNQEFFPIDGQGLGNEGNNHNFHFTDEVHTQFTYKGGEVFTFTGDDDLFAYVNKKLVINLGGVHSAETQTVDLDKQAGALGLTKGNAYPLDLFGAERHVTQSHYRIDTTIDCFTPVPPPK